MIALDTSAIVAIALEEDEADLFSRAIASSGALVGTPTLVETRMVLTARIPDDADAFLDGLIRRPSVHPVAFSLAMYEAARDAFHRFGKGRGHPAALNYGDCMAYAVARVQDVPLLFKGDDFSRTDIRSVLLARRP